MNDRDARIQFSSTWAINNLLLSKTKTLSIVGYGYSWTLLEDLTPYKLQEPPKVYIHKLVSGDRWMEAGAATGASSLSYKVTKSGLWVQNPGAMSPTSATLRYKLMTRGMG